MPAMGGEMDGGRLKRRLPIQIFVGSIGDKNPGRFFLVPYS
jgi:hypothetical protein